ncbi:MAG TPA: hypothetical protein VOA87_18390, partial [Thermoanaerobaculia bacterium]|nr:hypothetical protein [Thermoanaerobaculia bacterium]
QQDSQAALAQAKLDLDAATAAVAGAPVAKDSRADVETMKGELAALKATLAEAQTAFSADDFATARQKADKVKQEAAAITADVAKAVHKTKKR